MYEGRARTLDAQLKCTPPLGEMVCPVRAGRHAIEISPCKSAEDVPVIKYASGFAMYATRLAMTSGSAMGIFDKSTLDNPEVFFA